METELLTRHQLAERLNFSIGKIDLMVKAGEIPFFKIGRSVRFSWSKVMEALAEKSEPAAK